MTGVSSPYPGMEYVSGDDCLPVCLELNDDR